MAHFNDIVTRLYLNGDWRDISTHVRAEGGVAYQRGRGPQDDTTPPQSCTLTLDNSASKGNGDYTEQNPMGQWYGYLGRFTPAEVLLRKVKDTATTAASNGWGSTEAHSVDGVTTTAWDVLAWSRFGGAAGDYAKATGKATHTIGAANSSRLSYLADYSARDFGAVFTITPNFSNVTGGPLYIDFVARGQSTSSFYCIRVEVGTDESISSDFTDATGTSLIGGSATIAGLTWASGAPLKIRVAVEGRTLRSKVWGASSPEPFAWSDSFTDEADVAATAALCDAAGFVGIRSTAGVGNSNVPVTFTYDDFEVYSLVTAGEVESWPQSRDVTGRDQTVQITIRGPKGRLATAKTIARSALYQQFKVNAFGGFVPTPDAYFPLEDGAQTVTEGIQEASGSLSHLHFEVQPAPANTTVGKVTWAADATRPGSKQSPAVVGGGALFATIVPPTSSSTWGLVFQAKHNYADGFLMSASTSAPPGVSPLYYRIRITANTTLLEVDLITAGVNPMMTYDYGSKEEVEGWHTIQLEGWQTGPDIGYFLYVDGEFVDSYTHTSATLQGLAYINLGTVDNAPGSTAYGHLAVFGDLIANVDPSAIHQAALGEPGEAPVFRAKRIAQEYGHEFDWIGFGGITGSAGGTGDGKPMGPQRVVNVLDLLNDAEKVDGGLLYEQRSLSAFQFRALRSMSGRSSWLTLNMATSKHLSDLLPTSDNRDLCNRFTAQRAAGGEYVYSLDSGSMSTESPSDGGIGVVDRGDTFNLESGADLPDIARYRVARGTIGQERYPRVVVELHRAAVLNTSGLIAKLHDLDIGDQITLAGLTSNSIYDDRDVVVLGISGRLDQLRHTKTLATMPAELTRVLQLSSSVASSTEASRIGAGHTTLAEALTTTETDVTVEVETGKAFWVNSVSHANRFPFDVICGGERMTVTAGTAPAGQQQTWTVTRSVNGVTKEHEAGSKIDLFSKNYLGL